jgi:GNAT superfamily N-acetyltransferase
LPDLPGLTIDRVDVDQLIGAVSGLDLDDVRRLFARQHYPYLARINGAGVGYGWVASRRAEIGELGVTLTLAPNERYLWDFVTLPEWRGRGIYPRIIQRMLNQESAAERFWIGHDRPNVASARGILKAGFHLTVELYIESGRSYLLPVGPLDRARVAAALLGIPLVKEDADQLS